MRSTMRRGLYDRAPTPPICTPVDHLSELAAGAEPGAIVGANTILTYAHDGPVMLSGSDHGYEPTGREVVVEVDEAVRCNGDG